MVDDLLDRWSEKVAMKFVQDTFAKIEHIANFPEIYPESRDIPGVRRCVVNPNVSLY
jgi:plasmid stabilization system protein ParE